MTMLAEENQLDSIQMMLVDDDESILTLLAGLFAHPAHADVVLRTHTDSEQALTELKERRFDIIITDLKMPKYSGLDILREARARDPRVLVVLVTGFGSIETTLEAIRLGAYDYLTKPFQLPEFEMKVNSAARHVRMTRRIENLETERDDLALENELLRARSCELEAELAQQQYRKAQEDRVLGLGRVQDVTGAGAKSRTLHYSDTGSGPSREKLRRELNRIDELRRQGLMNDVEHELSKKQILEAYYLNG